jgi:hypothetical protein
MMKFSFKYGQRVLSRTKKFRDQPQEVLNFKDNVLGSQKNGNIVTTKKKKMQTSQTKLLSGADTRHTCLTDVQIFKYIKLANKNHSTQGI